MPPVPSAPETTADELFAAHHGLVFGFCHRVLRDEGRALEATAAAFESIVPLLAGPLSNAAMQLVRAASRACTDLIDAAAADAPLQVPTDGAAATDPALVEIADWDHSRIEDFGDTPPANAGTVTRFEDLPGRVRCVLVLKFSYGATVAEIARVLACQPGTVKAHLWNGLLALAGKGNGHAL
jgi:DNA-directed RNA polymerase specialized sigma24 family protein